MRVVTKARREPGGNRSTMFRNHRSQTRNAERKQREKVTEHVTGIFNEIITADIAAAYPYDRRVQQSD
jgi:hypothetical protein